MYTTALPRHILINLINQIICYWGYSDLHKKKQNRNKTKTTTKIVSNKILRKVMAMKSIKLCCNGKKNQRNTTLHPYHHLLLQIIMLVIHGYPEMGVKKEK